MSFVWIKQEATHVLDDETPVKLAYRSDLGGDWVMVVGEHGDEYEVRMRDLVSL